MPDGDYRFKPTGEMQDFGQRMAHVIGFNMRACAQLKGEQKNVNLGQTPGKAEVMAALKETTEECNAVYLRLKGIVPPSSDRNEH